MPVCAANSSEKGEEGGGCTRETNEGIGNVAGGKANLTSTTSLPVPPLALMTTVTQDNGGQGIWRHQAGWRRCDVSLMSRACHLR